MRRGLTAGAPMAVLALGAWDDKDSGPGVTISADESKSLGLATAPALAVRYRTRVSGFGVA